jgi:hypothetical protein
MNSHHLHRIHEIGDDQGRIGDESLRASRAALGLNPDTRDILETPASRWLAALLLVIVILAALELRFGIPWVWPT